MENKYYIKGQKYRHKKLDYIAVYIGRGYRNRHTYEVVVGGNSSFKAGEKFTPIDPEDYFDIVKE